MLKWIIQKNLIRPEILDAFRGAFREQKLDFEEVLAIPFSHELPEFTPAKQLVFYGSTTLMMNAYAAPDFRSGVFFEPEKFAVNNYLDQWGNRMLNADGKVLRFGDFIDLHLHKQAEWFLRPNDDTKLFAGTTMEGAEIRAWYSRILAMEDATLNADTLIFASGAKEILREWRNFIVDGEVVSSSRYMLNGNLQISTTDLPIEMLDFVRECAANEVPSPFLPIRVIFCLLLSRNAI